MVWTSRRRITCGFFWCSWCSVISVLCSVLYIIVCIFIFFRFCHCNVCPSIYCFWLPLWYLQTCVMVMIGQIVHHHVLYTNKMLYWLQRNFDRCHWVPPVVSGVRGTWSLVLYVCFVDHCWSFCPFSFGHCVVCPSSIYGFRLPCWYLQTLLREID